MKVVEGDFEGQITIPVIRCHGDAGTAFDDYFVWVYQKNIDGNYQQLPSNFIQIVNEDVWQTVLPKGHYKIVLWGVKP